MQPRPDTSATTDAALAEAALREPAQYKAIVDRHAGPLGRYVRRILGRQSAAAEDVVQEVFIKAYVNLNDYDRTRPFAPWLYRIAHNEAVSHLRRKNVEPELIGGEDGELLLSKAVADSGATLMPGLRAGLERAFAALDPKYREVLVLRYLEDKDYEEISDILAMPPGTVAIRIKRGLERLRAGLRDWTD
jgi:RNA polymerase sigma-70 factor, ECF subfamily